MCPDTGCTIACIPKKVALDHHLAIEEADDDEPECQSYGGTQLDIVGQKNVMLILKDSKLQKLLKA